MMLNTYTKRSLTFFVCSVTVAHEQGGVLVAVATATGGGGRVDVDAVGLEPASAPHGLVPVSLSRVSAPVQMDLLVSVGPPG